MPPPDLGSLAQKKKKKNGGCHRRVRLFALRAMHCWHYGRTSAAQALLGRWLGDKRFHEQSGLNQVEETGPKRTENRTDIAFNHWLFTMQDLSVSRSTENTTRAPVCCTISWLFLIEIERQQPWNVWTPNIGFTIDSAMWKTRECTQLLLKDRSDLRRRRSRSPPVSFFVFHFLFHLFFLSPKMSSEEPADIFFSLRYEEAGQYAIVLQQELARYGVRAAICNVLGGGNIKKVSLRMNRPDVY